MIRLSRLNHREVAINSDLIESIEAMPDTTVRLISGECILVLEEVDEVIRRIVEYRRSTFVPAVVQAALLTAKGPGATGESQGDEHPRAGRS